EKVEKAVEGGLPDDPDERLKALEKVDITTLGLSFEDADALQYMQAAAIVAGLADWSRSEPLPTMQTVWDIKDEQLYDFLSEETRRLGAVRDVDFDPNPHDEDPANPTGRLSDSSGSSSEQEDPEALQPISSTSTTNSSSVA
ncbi:MAG: hypothetical protein KGR26_10915, partial [Cyanobacteria bacterium REEB65]|nr:hypothetical protein [Cyanobacteria bacterium REEB65]